MTQTGGSTTFCRWSGASRVVLALFCIGTAGCLQPLPPLFHQARTVDGQTLPPYREYWTAFRTPSQFNSTGLYLLRPYQPGQIPLVMIHGLASDAVTWECLINCLCQDPTIASKYQIWLYQYPTGHSYLTAAADLRRQLMGIRSHFDPGGTDRGFEQTVLVGHSMGGIIAKLQASYSDDKIWRSLSDWPIDVIQNSGRVPERTASALLFDPVPFVSNVIYIATPHRGSNWSGHPLGRLGRALISLPQQMQREYWQLVRSNPGLFRNPGPRIPTSLDHLTPGNPVILATNSLRYRAGVGTHSIIGTGHMLPDGFMGDGVVAFVSAVRSDVQSEKRIPATHSGILQHPETAAELTRLLTEFAIGNSSGTN